MNALFPYLKSIKPHHFGQDIKDHNPAREEHLIEISYTEVRCITIYGSSGALVLAAVTWKIVNIGLGWRVLDQKSHCEMEEDALMNLQLRQKSEIHTNRKWNTSGYL